MDKRVIKNHLKVQRVMLHNKPSGKRGRVVFEKTEKTEVRYKWGLSKLCNLFQQKAII